MVYFIARDNIYIEGNENKMFDFYDDIFISFNNFMSFVL